MWKFLIIGIFLISNLIGQEIDTVYILQTTDIHGRIHPYNYFRDKEANYGLAKAYTRLIDYRSKYENVVLVDCGDLIHGSPLTYYFNQIETEVPNPLIFTMNYMKYDAFAVGNHDIDPGVFTYLKAESESKFPWLSANSVLPDGSTLFKPYTIIRRSGIKIGIVGLNTPGIHMWLEPKLYPGITWADMVKSAAKYADKIRPKVDILIGIFHAGVDVDYNKAQSEALDLPPANAAGLVASEVPGFDVIFAGHSHRMFPEKVETIKKPDQTLIINAGYWAKRMGVAQLIFQKEEGQNKLIEKSGWLDLLEEVPPSDAILKLTQYYHDKTLNYIRTEIATLTDTLNTLNSRFEDNSMVDLIHDVQLHYTGADISIAASFNNNLVLPPGKLEIKDAFAIYRFTNYLYMIEMTGQQIKDYLEYSARYYQLDDNRVIPNPKIPGFDCDQAEGIKYQIDISKPLGSRIVNIEMEGENKNFQLNNTYKVAINSYRVMGGGGHIAAAGIKQVNVLFKSKEQIRNILIDYLKTKENISPQANKNWKIIQ